MNNRPAISPRESFAFFALILASIAGCLAVPRALSFLPEIAALIIVFYVWIKTRRIARLDGKLFAFLCGFTALAAISALWAPDYDYSLTRAAKIGGGFFGGFLLLMAAGTIHAATKYKERLTAAAVMLCALAGFYIVGEYHSDFALTRLVLGLGDYTLSTPESMRSGYLLNRSIVFLVLLCMPVILMLESGGMSGRNKWALRLLLAASVLPAVFSTHSQTAQIAAGLGVAALLYPSQKLMARRILMLGVAVAMLVSPLLAPPVYKAFFATETASETEGFLREASVPHRLEVWKFVSEQIYKAPVLGHGIEATRFLKAGYVMENMQTDHVLHPHNGVLQIWVEFGLVGIGLAIAFVVLLFLKLDSLPALLQRYYTTLFIVLLGVLCTGYGLWQAWLVGMLILICAFSIMVSNLNNLKPTQ